MQHQLGLIAGGEAGRRAAVASGMQISADTLLRRVVHAPEQAENRTRHVGIDEWVWHRGHRYGTLIVNLDTHRPLVLLPGREQRTLAAWFKKYPEILVVSRDRGGSYALAARDGAPQAIQVAERWHLLKNIGDALERMMYRHMPLIRLVATELSLKNKTLKRLCLQSQRYVALKKLNNSGVTSGISAGLRSTLFIKKVAGSEKYHVSPGCPG